MDTLALVSLKVPRKCCTILCCITLCFETLTVDVHMHRFGYARFAEPKPKRYFQHTIRDCCYRMHDYRGILLLLDRTIFRKLFFFFFSSQESTKLVQGSVGQPKKGARLVSVPDWSRSQTPSPSPEMKNRKMHIFQVFVLVAGERVWDQDQGQASFGRSIGQLGDVYTSQGREGLGKLRVRLAGRRGQFSWDPADRVVEGAWIMLGKLDIRLHVWPTPSAT